MREARSLMRTIAAACFFASLSGHVAVAGDLPAPALFEALKAGGYVIYIRHAKSNMEQADHDPVVISNCATQRLLSDDGRKQAQKIGATFQVMGIHVDYVLSSPYCRAMETAALAFPSVERKVADMLSYSLGLPKEAAERAAGELKKVLATTPKAGANTVLIGHTSNLKEAAGLWPKKEGGALIFRPDGQGAFAFVGTLEPAEFEKTGS